MITLAILKDKTVDGQNKAKGRKIRKVTALTVDNYNIALSESTGTSPLMGRKYTPNFVQMVPCLKEFDIDPDHARCEVIKAFEKLSGEKVGDISWEEIDEKFSVSKRRTDSTGILVLSDTLKKAGWENE